MAPNAASHPANAQPRDFVGYGANPPYVIWPGGAKVAINLVLNYEEGSEYNWLDDGRNDNWGEYNNNGTSPHRDLGTETHFEYGSRVGVWRLARLFDRYNVPITVSACAVALEKNRAVAEWMNSRGHDLLGHGLRWTDYPGMPREEEDRQLHEAIALYQKVLGRRPLGWNCRSFPSVNTRDLLVREGGFLYHSDPCNDELPYFVDHGGQRILVVPYSKTLNDSRFLIAPGYSNPRDFAEDCRSAIDYMLWEADETGGRMLNICVHARWMGQPNRAAGLRAVIEHIQKTPGVIFMRRADIARYWIDNQDSFTRRQGR
ncbi:polysaccharide deacetylase family protein [Mesorhizobium sp. CA13]|uniref:polysaccharide deacetylase family protein n=1 Tax=unclassified Mesorhizobium TaxID=325217 RepID=UPI00112EA10E|nr:MULTISPECIES: polysaccharide deacetylase family protein [unclassified Mesorhizobium]MBZ9856424.1 polysaccharide deacetylase family protein [Mesorhizobium sp. CA13]MBZ9965828.1 polysaccharide deacetylase family protein [Mesorhizobium sp. BR1-1-2]MCA0011946.1 polysaccharide deacetylase family protein [Mesorhizobium sp. B294B1A1]MCA0038200.1 polysaccharide deacetylase family protein [Mesorhizobium sp. B292B1B]TPM44070.1 polysaccharide deacetylase [Mesorhizobium sp. B2-3-2]